MTRHLWHVHHPPPFPPPHLPFPEGFMGFFSSFTILLLIILFKRDNTMTRQMWRVHHTSLYHTRGFYGSFFFSFFFYFIIANHFILKGRLQRQVHHTPPLPPPHPLPRVFTTLMILLEIDYAYNNHHHSGSHDDEEGFSFKKILLMLFTNRYMYGPVVEIPIFTIKSF